MDVGGHVEVGARVRVVRQRDVGGGRPTSDIRPGVTTGRRSTTEGGNAVLQRRVRRPMSAVRLRRPLAGQASHAAPCSEWPPISQCLCEQPRFRTDASYGSVLNSGNDATYREDDALLSGLTESNQVR